MNATAPENNNGPAVESAVVPVSIQPHGVLIAATATDLMITHVSRNASKVLGFTAESLIGQPLSAVFGVEWIDEGRVLLEGERDPHRMGANIAGRAFDVIVHRSGQYVVLELEVDLLTPQQEVLSVYRAIQRLTRATTDRDLWDMAAVALQELTGFDRVMVYALHPDGHGEVVAEEARDGMERYLGLHFPASDFTEQVHESYIKRRSRMIVSSTAVPSVVIDAVDSSAPSLDLSGAELRGLSEHDLYFMTTLGHASLLSLSLVRGGELIGVISLASRTSVVVPYAIRQGLEALANQIAMHLSSMAQIRRLTESMRLRGLRMQLTEQLVQRRTADASAIAAVLLQSELTMLDLIPADGAMVCLGSFSASVGTAPNPATARAAALTLVADRSVRPVATGALAEDYPEIARLLPSVSGLIIAPLPGFDGFLAWFRSESPTRLKWFGADPEAEAVTSEEAPQPFPSWSQTISGRSMPWTGLETDAEDLARDLTVVMLRQAETQLAALALRDALTGLPNRRLLMDRIELGLTRPTGESGITVLFVDLDSFKSVNDTHGHDAGDRLLVQIANRILATTRAPDTVARLGGDEFVVLCDEITAEEAAAVADRIAETIRQPIDIGGSFVTVTASVGMAVSAQASTAAELLKRADGAMYRAKAQGRDRVSA